MDNRWWELPGPGGFIRDAWENLQAGKNLVPALPTTTPQGLREALAAAVRYHELWTWRDFPADSGEKNAAELAESLHARFAPPERVGAVLNAFTLADTVIWVEGMTSKCWPMWNDFLSQYQHACRSRVEQGRGMFCVPLVGSLARSAPVPDVTLSVRRWRGIVGPVELLIDLSLNADGLANPPLHRRLAFAVACELAGSDAVLARELMRLDLRQLLDPFAFLCERARSRAWDAERVRQPSWEEGSLDFVGDDEMVHSVVLALRGDEDGLRRRIWRAEVAVLFPFLGEQRLRMLPSLRSYLRLPLETDLGYINDIHDLELGQLLRFLRGRNLPRTFWRRLNLLTDMRHSLAHLRPVSVAALFADELLRDS